MRRAQWTGAFLWFVLALPDVRRLAEATMVRHMLIQLPLLALAGWLLGRGIKGIDGSLSGWNHRGIAGLVLVSVTAAIWMIPLSLDAALQNSWVETAKFLSIPLLTGVPLALSWPIAGFIVRGVFLVESTATAFRLGWLFLASPQRLCSNYLLDDQQRLGQMLLALGAAGAAILIWKLIFGHITIENDKRPDGKAAH